MRARYATVVLPLLLSLVFLLTPGCNVIGPLPQNAPPPAQPKTTGSVHLTLGVPSAARPDESVPGDYLLTTPEYALSYNSTRGGPNWVAWHLDASDLGSVERSNNFHPDDRLPQPWQVRPNDYTGSGYDRGHVCPSGDRTNNPKANEATFSMANMLPQVGPLNRVSWEGLESYSRDLVKKGNELYIYAGGYGTKAKFANGKIVAPTHCWKVIVVCPKGKAAPPQITTDTQIIAVNFPNEETVDPDWHRYQTTVEQIEKATGLKFFDELSSDVAASLRSKTSGAGTGTAASKKAGPDSSASSGAVIGNKKSKIYHERGCPGYDQVSEQNRVPFKSAKEAEAAGYKRAGNCP